MQGDHSATDHAMLLSEPAPAVHAANRPHAAAYRLRMAATRDDIRAAQALRFMVFNLEMQEGLQASFENCLDADRFDDACDHLLVEDGRSGAVVGTYRLQTGDSAARHFGYYSEQEFDFRPFEALRAGMLELGRACIHAEHRSFSVLALLWNGIAAYARRCGARYLIGCSSLTSRDPAVGAAVYRRLLPHLAAPGLRTAPLPRCACPLDVVARDAMKTPKLLAAYLGLGAMVCGAPAIDVAFGSIDFLTLVDLHDPAQARRLARFGIHDA